MAEPLSAEEIAEMTPENLAGAQPLIQRMFATIAARDEEKQQIRRALISAVGAEAAERERRVQLEDALRELREQGARMHGLLKEVKFRLGAALYPYNIEERWTEADETARALLSGSPQNPGGAA